MLTQPNTTKSQTQHPFPAQTQAHFIPNGSRLAESYQYSYFLHDANMLDQQGMGHDPRTPTVRQVREVCTQREPTERVIIVIVAEREERKKEIREERKREKGREKEREETPFPPPRV